MRPLELTLEGFGSYASKNTVNFDDEALCLFLVAGDTGAGKSTLFEAIVFALYGSTNMEQKIKSKRNARGDIVSAGSALRSHFGSGNCSVTLRFTAGRSGTDKKTYTVTRTPALPPKKDTSKTPRPATVKLELPDGSMLEGSEANRRLLDIVRLTQSQFMQVGMLAQGKFMKLLTASTEEKQKIFRQLFGTELYENIQKELQARAAQSRAETEGWWNRMHGLAESVSLAPVSADEPQEFTAFRNVCSALKEQKSPDIVLAERLAETLDALIVLEQQQAKALGEEAGKAAQKAKEASEERHRAEKLQELFEDAAKAQKEFDAAQAGKPEADRQKKLADDLTAAFRLQELASVWDAQESKLRETKAQILALERSLPELEKKKAEAQSAFSCAEEQFKRTQKTHSALAAKVDQAVEHFDQHHDLLRKIKETDKKLSRARTEHSQKELDLRQLREDADSFRAELQALSDVGVHLEQRQGQKKILDDAENQRRETVKARKEKEAAEAAFDKANEEYEARYAALDQAEAALHGDWAAILSAELKKNEPCPVCGSTTHPHPHAPARLGTLTQEELEKERESVRILHNAESKARAARDTAREISRRMEEQLQKIMGSVRDIAGKNNVDVDDTATHDAVIKKVHTFIRTDLIRLRKDKEKVPLLTKGVLESEQKEAELRDAIGDLDKTKSSLVARKEELERSAASLLKQIPFESKSAAKAEYGRAEEVYKDAENRRKSAQQAASATSGAAAKEAARLETLRDQLPSLEKDADNAQRTYIAALQEGYLSEDDWRTLVNAHQKKDIESYRRFAESFEKTFNARKGAAEAAKKKTEGRTPIDVEPLVILEQDAVKLSSEINSVSAQTEARLEIHLQTQKKLAKSLETHTEQAANQARLERLSSRFRGQTSRQKIGLETYVQRTYFESVLDAANERFSDLTGGQYELQLLDIDQSGLGQAQGGLELMVYSHATGQAREINTLSGGESFMAALSLALGMADIIEQRSADVRLDMMFVDEGFGSLDDNARREAVRILQQLTGGDKLIGIISHVSELKKEIDDQLLVTKDNTGSHVRWNNR